MKKNEIESLIRHIENCTDTQIEHELEAVQIIIENLFESKKYSAISNLYLGLPGYHKELCSFEAAFSLAHQKKDFEAIEAYENLLKFQPRNTTVLFNLHLLKIDQDDIHGAFNLISKAHDLEPEDNKIKKQFIKLKEYTDELQQIDERFRNASLLISSENEYVVNRLNNFITNFKKDPEQYNFKLVIPRWKFQALIGADREKAYSLSEQWIEKFYIRKTGNRNQHRALEFELNPYLENSIKNASLRKIETKWIKGFENLNTEYLDHIGYSEQLKKIDRIKKKFREVILRDFKEIVFNYSVKNTKSLIVLSGSLIEALLIYHLEKKQTQEISYINNGRTISKSIYGCSLHDLVSHCEQNNLLPKQFMHLASISRIYRNFVHPGLELKGTEKLDEQKHELCFISVMQLLKAII